MMRTNSRRGRHFFRHLIAVKSFRTGRPRNVPPLPHRDWLYVTPCSSNCMCKRQSRSKILALDKEQHT